MLLSPNDADASSSVHYDAHNLGLCLLMQQEEFEVLESIYPECISSKQLERTVKLEIPVEFDTSKSCVIQSSLDTTDPSTPNKVTLSLSALPPLLVHLVLPTGYPLYSPPEIVSIRATHGWLPHTSSLKSALLHLWQRSEPVLYNWVECIRSGEFLRSLDLTSSTDGDAIVLPHHAPRLLQQLLSSYDLSSRSNHFNNNSYLCSICLTSFKGSKCLQLACSHTFCRSCLEDFWKLCIREGDVGRVGCPDPECVKAGSEACENDVARVVAEVEVQRWRWLREKRLPEKDPTIQHCPMQFCQTPVHKPKDVDPKSGWDRFRQCSSCSFSFCSFCKYTWHGPISSCPIAYTERTVLEYMGMPEGSTQRTEYEARYGPEIIRCLVARYEQEKSTKEWINSSTTNCPGCETNVEKSMGCNHMTCSKCKAHFCYRCGASLDANHPYDHFSAKGNPCFNKLFDFGEEDEHWR